MKVSLLLYRDDSATMLMIDDWEMKENPVPCSPNALPSLLWSQAPTKTAHTSQRILAIYTFVKGETEEEDRKKNTVRAKEIRTEHGMVMGDRHAIFMRKIIPFSCRFRRRPYEFLFIQTRPSGIVDHHQMKFLIKKRNTENRKRRMNGKKCFHRDRFSCDDILRTLIHPDIVDCNLSLRKTE